MTLQQHTNMKNPMQNNLNPMQPKTLEVKHIEATTPTSNGDCTTVKHIKEERHVGGGGSTGHDFLSYKEKIIEEWRSTNAYQVLLGNLGVYTNGKTENGNAEDFILSKYEQGKADGIKQYLEHGEIQDEFKLILSDYKKGLVEKILALEGLWEDGLVGLKMEILAIIKK